MREIPDNVFATQQMLTELARSQSESLERIFHPYDLKASVAAAGGLLTVPELQANTVRLEAIAHLIVASSAGKKKPSKQDTARWFRQVGQAFAHMEDAAEDVFVGRVHIDGRNYRVLEGLAEANCHHLQHMLTAVENMPDRGVYAALKQSCRAMLALSDLVWAIFWAHGMPQTHHPRGWTIAHVWKATKDPDAYTHLANLCLMPECLGSLSDKGGPLCGFLEYHAWSVYGWRPAHADAPAKPEGYDNISWRYLDPHAAPLVFVRERVMSLNNQRVAVLRQLMGLADQ